MILILFAIISIPKILWQKIFLKKKFPTLKERFGFFPPSGKGTLRIWIHAVSVGEVKAAQPLVAALSKMNPTLLITTATLAGKEEALRSFPDAYDVKIMPLDFTWVMRWWLDAFSPHQLLFVEGDLWPNLLREAKRRKIKTALLSGKISERSLRRFLWVPFFSRKFFGRLDLICAQNEEQKARFEKLVDQPVHAMGNLKLEIAPQFVDPETIRRRFSLAGRKAITIASTHAPEEKELLEALAQIPVTIFLAPRHPERFREVASFLEKQKIPFCRWHEDHKGESLILVDVMGQLPHCFSVSNLAIVAGSFSSRLGGHNIWEPCSYGCPVLFGPHMHAQRELVSLVVEAGAGAQVDSSQLAAVVQSELKSPTLSCKKLSSRKRSSERMMKLLFSK